MKYLPGQLLCREADGDCSRGLRLLLEVEIDRALGARQEMQGDRERRDLDVGFIAPADIGAEMEVTPETVLQF